MRNELDTIGTQDARLSTRTIPSTSTDRVGRLDEGPIRASAGDRYARLFQCNGCDEVIGVYEPLVVVDGTNARITSRAAEPDLEASFGKHYHRDCYLTQHSRA